LLACAAVFLGEFKEAQGFQCLCDPVIILSKELECQDAEHCNVSNADKEEAQEGVMEAAQHVKDKRPGFSAEEDMKCSLEDDAEMAGASMGALTLPAAKGKGGTFARLHTARGLASLKPSADNTATEPRRPGCAAQNYKEVSTNEA
jgi:hypothetical protein